MSELLALSDSHSYGRVHVLRVAVLGIPVEFATNDRAVLAVADTAFGAWRDSPQHHVSEATAVVRITVNDAAAPTTGGPVSHRLQDGGLVITGCGCMGMTHHERREAAAYIARHVLDDAMTFRTEVLEALTWGLLTRLDRQPLHAAAIATDEAALLIHGPSGAGKSTLALAGARAGFHAAGDDMAFLQSRPRLRVWTAPGPLHLLPSSATALGMDTSNASMRVRADTTKVAVEAHTAGARAFDRSGLCLVGPRTASARARQLSDAEAMSMLNLGADAGFHVFADSIAPAVARVIRGGAWLLEPSSSAEDSVPLLAGMLADIARVGRST